MPRPPELPSHDPTTPPPTEGLPTMAEDPLQKAFHDMVENGTLPNPIGHIHYVSIVHTLPDGTTVSKEGRFLPDGTRVTGQILRDDEKGVLWVNGQRTRHSWKPQVQQPEQSV